MDRVCPGRDGRPDDHQPAGAVRAQRRSRRRSRHAGTPGHGGRQRGRPDSLGVAVRRPRPRDDAARHGAGVGGRDASIVCLARAGPSLFRARCLRILVLRNAAFRVCVSDGGFVRHSQPWTELWRAVHGLGRRRHLRTDDWRTRI